MSNLKKSAKSKFIQQDFDDFLNDSQFLNNSQKKVKPTKRQRNDIIQKDIAESSPSKLINSKNCCVSEGHLESEPKQKILKVLCGQLQLRKQINNTFLKSFSGIITQMETDYSILKDNEQKLEYLTGSFIKSVQQSNTAHQDRLKTFKEIFTTFKKENEEINTKHETEINKLGVELEEDMNNFKQKLIADTKRNGWETLRRSFMQAMQNDF